MSAGGPEQGSLPLVGGRLLAEITNRIVALMREHYGRGPIKAKTYVLDNLIVCVLSDGFTLIGVNAFMFNIILGAAILAAMLFNIHVGRLRRLGAPR